MGILLNNKKIAAKQSGGLVTSFKLNVPVKSIPVFKVPYEQSKKSTIPKLYKNKSIFETGLAAHVSNYNHLYNTVINGINQSLINNDNESYKKYFGKFQQLQSNIGDIKSELANIKTRWDDMRKKTLTDNDLLLTNDADRIIGYTKKYYGDGSGKIEVNPVEIPKKAYVNAFKNDIGVDAVIVKKNENGENEYIDYKEFEKEIKEGADKKNYGIVYISSAKYIRDRILDDSQYCISTEAATKFLDAMEKINTYEGVVSGVKKLSSMVDETVVNLFDIGHGKDENPFTILSYTSDSNGNLRAQVINPISNENISTAIKSLAVISNPNVESTPGLKYVQVLSNSTNAPSLKRMEKIIGSGSNSFTSVKAKLMTMSINDAKKNKIFKDSDIYWEMHHKEPVNDFLREYVGLLTIEARLTFDALYENNPDMYIKKNAENFINYVVHKKMAEKFEEQYKEFIKSNSSDDPNKKEITSKQLDILKHYITFLMKDEKGPNIKDITLKKAINNNYRLDATTYDFNKNGLTSYNNLQDAYMAVFEDDIDYDDVLNANKDKYINSFNNRNNLNKYKENKFNYLITNYYDKNITNLFFIALKNNNSAQLSNLTEKLVKNHNPKDNLKIEYTNYNDLSAETTDLSTLIYNPGTGGGSGFKIEAYEFDFPNRGKDVNYDFFNFDNSSNYKNFDFITGKEFKFHDNKNNIFGRKKYYQVTMLPSFFAKLNKDEKAAWVITNNMTRNIIDEVKNKVNPDNILTHIDKSKKINVKENGDYDLIYAHDAVLFDNESNSNVVKETLAPFLLNGYLIKNYNASDVNQLFHIDDKGNIAVKDKIDYLRLGNNIKIKDVDYSSLSYRKGKNNDKYHLIYKYKAYNENGESIKEFEITDPYTIKLYIAHSIIHDYVNNGGDIGKFFNDTRNKNTNKITNKSDVRDAIEKGLEMNLISAGNKRFTEYLRSSNSTNYNNLSAYKNLIKAMTGNNISLDQNGGYVEDLLKNVFSKTYNVVPVFVQHIYYKNDISKAIKLYNEVDSLIKKENKDNKSIKDFKLNDTVRELSLELGFSLDEYIENRNVDDFNDKIWTYCRNHSELNCNKNNDSNLDDAINAIYNSIIGKADDWKDIGFNKKLIDKKLFLDILLSKKAIIVNPEPAINYKTVEKAMKPICINISNLNKKIMRETVTITRRSNEHDATTGQVFCNYGSDVISDILISGL